MMVPVEEIKGAVKHVVVLGVISTTVMMVPIGGSWTKLATIASVFGVAAGRQYEWSPKVYATAAGSGMALGVAADLLLG